MKNVEKLAVEFRLFTSSELVVAARNQLQQLAVTILPLNTHPHSFHLKNVEILIKKICIMQYARSTTSLAMFCALDM